ncbi:FecCD family ABC transporter permease [Oceanobacillus alkalisoli]|uniref:FecCD family ABC transporter permease n=1 Tax=Oceanobacillus alkalisoli TaxID=2925113 RepID=UPI001EF02E7B|nr:iron ABC transporter permease [Oceanobacillus alkalisoli]MCF3944705.1 iron ABC transporter permease [Oceanobacillus alkalisoli]MCG5105079.1 iron ABC transporter permease [Oceanobacillus alkalisoli]
MNKLTVKWKRSRVFKTTITLIMMTIILAVAFIVGVSLGPISIPFKETIMIFLHKLQLTNYAGFTEQQWVVITEVRLPRVLVASFVGAALAVAGVAMQGLFRNPLVEPGYIGVSSGAALGAVSAIFFGWSAINEWFLPLSAFIGALFAMFVILLVWRATNQRSIAVLLLLGIGVNSFFSAVMNVLVATSKNEQELRGIVFWLQGGLEARTWEHVLIISIPITLGIFILFLFGSQLNMMLLGEDHAKTSGINTRVTRNLVLTVAALITGAAVAVSGIIGFIGLVVPHILRLAVGPDHRLLLPASALGGAAFLIFADLISRMVIQPITLQVGVVSALIGAPLFVFLIIRAYKGVSL